MATLAFYKGKGLIFDKLIRWWTKSQYSHVELIIQGNAYSSSNRDGGARVIVNVEFNQNNWDFVEVEIDPPHAMRVFGEHENKGYDWIGIVLTQVLPLKVDSPRRVFCSELVAKMMGLNNAANYSPQDLYEYTNNNKYSKL